MVSFRLMHCSLVIAATASALAVSGLPAQPLDPDVEKHARQERLSDSDLKSFYLECSRTGRRSLGMGGVAECSVGYELLLQRTFEGDFYALLAWSRRQHADGAKGRFEDREPTDTESPHGI
jgi:hypothetical protein